MSAAENGNNAGSRASSGSASGYARISAPRVVTAIDHESADVLSLTMQSVDGQPLPMALPGQYVCLTSFKQTAAGPATFFAVTRFRVPLRLSVYRISVKN